MMSINFVLELFYMDFRFLCKIFDFCFVCLLNLAQLVVDKKKVFFLSDLIYFCI